MSEVNAESTGTSTEVAVAQPTMPQMNEVKQEVAVSTPSSSDNSPAQEVSTQVAPSEPVYTPKYEVSVYDNKYEIPEKFRSFMTKENEKDFHDIFTKYHALDPMKEKHQKTVANYEKIKSEYEPVRKGLDKLSNYLKNDDFDSFFGTLQIPEEKLQQWMLQKLQLKELPVDQQEVYNKKSEYQRMLYEREQEAAHFKQLYEETQLNQKEIEKKQIFNQLDTALSRPDVDAIARSFDAKLGQSGAFKNEVIQRAAMISQATGKNLSVEEAVSETLKYVAWNNQGTGEKVVQPQAASSKPVLPNVAGQATSPVSQKIKSLDDLKKLRDQMLNQ
jgi:hypothetical protein